ncbi:MAG: hypothetical protein HY202_04285 [Nitrospirae bacterium]|nr:hypothetical protein [Nitrospirota bacterium]MBI3605228.1 hypothetical protein [Nitrospirota bacterium]
MNQNKLFGLMFVLLFLFFQGEVRASEDILHTKHNLAANPDIQATSSGININGEICVFCHTPHGGRTDVAGGGAPLWNRRLSDSTLFTPYDSPNFDKAGLTPGRPKGVSLACLSCHDGTIAFDSLINAPGSGGLFSNNKNLAGAGGSIGLTFNGQAVDSGNKFKSGDRTDSAIGGYVFYNTTNTGGAEPFPNLGTDLTNDHPVGMAIPQTDPQFALILANKNTNSGTDGHLSGTNKVFWLTRDGALQTDPRDRLRAYSSDTTSLDTPYIECASCHNPHEASRLTGQPLPTDPVNATTVNNSRFLRAPNPNQPGADMNDRNASSALCLSCHQK